MEIRPRPTTARRREIRCPDCNEPRMVSLEHACRVARGEASAKCMTCRKPVQVKVTQEHRDYWLSMGPEKLAPILASAAFLPDSW